MLPAWFMVCLGVAVFVTLLATLALVKRSQSLVDALREGPVVVVAGMGHMLYDAGILESVRTRSAARQSVLLPYPMDGTTKPAEELLRALKDPTSEDLPLADFFWLNPQ